MLPYCKEMQDQVEPLYYVSSIMSPTHEFDILIPYSLLTILHTYPAISSHPLFSEDLHNSLTILLVNQTSSYSLTFVSFCPFPIITSYAISMPIQDQSHTTFSQSLSILHNPLFSYQLHSI